MMKKLFQFLKYLLPFLETIRWIKWLKQSFSEKYAKLLLNLELFNFMNALTVNISATLPGWFASALLNGGFPPLVLKKRFPADSLSPPFPCDWKHLEVKFWNMVDCFLPSARAANEIIFKTKSNLFISDGLFRSLLSILSITHLFIPDSFVTLDLITFSFQP